MPADGTAADGSRYPWEAEAIRRNTEDGVTLGALARQYGVAWWTVRAAFARHGVRPLLPVERPRSLPLPEWAAEAASRYDDGEPMMSLAGDYGVSITLIRRVLTQQGRRIRTPHEAVKANRATREGKK